MEYLEATGLNIPMLCLLSGVSLFTLLMLAQTIFGRLQKKQSNVKVSINRNKLLLIGPAGSGKTRLFNQLVAGLLEVKTVSSTEANIAQSMLIPAKTTGA